MARQPTRGKGAALPPPDPEEEAALVRAASTLRDLAPSIGDPRAVATAVISSWIIERVRLSVGRISGKHAFRLDDAHLRGSLEAALPEIGEALGHLPADKPLFGLSRDEVVDVLVAGCQAGRRTGALLNDEIPF